MPHFEKMLYDNALLIMAYSAAYSLTQNHIYLDTAVKTADYIQREMTSSEGGFFCAQDADNEGVEGKYYTFTLDEIMTVFGDKGQRFAEVFDITEHGNFGGKNIPNLLKSSDLPSGFDDELQKLYEYRRSRTELRLDDKILLSWNAIMCAAMSMLYRVTNNKKYLRSAERAQEFIERNMSDVTMLFASFRKGGHSEQAFLDDYAYYVAALIEIYNSTLDGYYIELAERFCKEAVRRFADGNGGFNMCESNELFMNPKELYDGAAPSGNSVMAYDLVRLYQLTGKDIYREYAEKQIAFMTESTQDYPAGNCMFLLAKLMYEVPPSHITVAVKGTDNLSEIRLPFLANVSAQQTNEQCPLLNNRTTYYICIGNMCLPPVNEIAPKR